MIAEIRHHCYIVWSVGNGLYQLTRMTLSFNLAP